MHKGNRQRGLLCGEAAVRWVRELYFQGRADGDYIKARSELAA